MKLLLSFVPLLLCGGLATAGPVGSAFLYNGLLHDNGAPANGAFDLQFRLFDDPLAGSPVATAPVLALEDVAVNNGLFTVTLDFGAAVFNGSARFLEIGVRPGAGTGSFSMLPQRQPVLPTPEAVHAAKADSVASGATVRSLNGLTDAVSLDAGANVTLTPNGNGLRISAAGPGGSGIWSLNEADTYYNGGKVGIGTASPFTSLHINSASDTYLSLDKPAVSYECGIAFRTGGTAKWFLFTDNDGTDDLKIGRTGEPDATPRIQLPAANNNILLGLSGGNVGIGTTTPATPLQVVGPATFSNPGDGNVIMEFGIERRWQFRQLSSGASTALELATVPASNPKDFIITGRNVGIGTTTPQAKLDVNGTFAANVITVKGADISEPFDIDAAGGALEPGMLACIDPANPGKLVLSSKAHDRTVAGVISGAGGVNPGMLMSAPGTLADGKHPVALTGRVYAWADASAAPIRPGDLLTTSDTPGHAMRVGDHTAAQGAIIGKAMTALAAGKGLVLVLVSLQ